MKLATAFLCTVSALSLTSMTVAAVEDQISYLRGPHDQKDDLSNGVNVGDDGFFGQLVCLGKGKNDAGKCANSVNTNDQACSFCTNKMNPNKEEGLCVDPVVASQMMQMNLVIECTNTNANDNLMMLSKNTSQHTLNLLSVSVSTAVVEQTKHDQKAGLGGPFDVLTCTIHGEIDETKCSTSVNEDDQACSYCSMSTNGQEAGLCVDPQVASQMMDQNADVACTNTATITIKETKEEVSVAGNFDALKCTIEGKTDATKCSTSVNEDDQACSYCSISTNGQEAGLCVDPQVASQMTDQNSNVSCASQNIVTSNQPLSSKPITDCNIDGIDHVTCLDPSKVNGSKCVWCDAGIGGFCFPEAWEETAGRFLSCGPDSILALE